MGFFDPFKVKLERYPMNIRNRYPTKKNGFRKRQLLLSKMIFWGYSFSNSSGTSWEFFFKVRLPYNGIFKGIFFAAAKIGPFPLLQCFKGSFVNWVWKVKTAWKPSPVKWNEIVIIYQKTATLVDLILKNEAHFFFFPAYCSPFISVGSMIKKTQLIELLDTKLSVMSCELNHHEQFRLGVLSPDWQVWIF